MIRKYQEFLLKNQDEAAVYLNDALEESLKGGIKKSFADRSSECGRSSEFVNSG